MFIRFDMIHERDRHADRRTDRQTPHDGIGRAYACIASCGNKTLVFDLPRSRIRVGHRRRMPKYKT